MRILLVDHWPAKHAARTAGLADALRDAGHEVRALCGDHPPGSLPPFAIGRAGLATGEWADRRVADWRAAARRALDRAVDDLDPAIIHCQQLWLFAQLAVETGVPLCVTAGAAELAACRRDGHFRRFVDQAAWNAAALLAENSRVLRELIAAWPHLDDIAQALPNGASPSRFEDDPRGAAALVCLAAYDRVLAERFGTAMAR
jgi:hypothetical protein